MADDDRDLVWRGPFRTMLRPATLSTARSIGVAVSVLWAAAAVASGVFTIGWTHIHGANRSGIAALFLLATVMSPVVLSVRFIPARPLEVLFPCLAVFGITLASLLLGALVVFAGPSGGAVAVFFVEIPLLAFFVLHGRWALLFTAFALVGYAVALAMLDRSPSPTQQFLDVLASSVATGVVMAGIANRMDGTRRELADLNQHLEVRVAEQVDELERTARLRRFLSRQIAEVVTSEGADEILAPHRCEVAVLFVDLRGFTHFTNVVNADHVMHVLGEYYRVVGAVLDEHGATIGGFDGDGVMAYIGDPVPVDKPAHEALFIAQEIARALDELLDGWSVEEARLGYGIGVAFGLATLGVVGSEGRSDYTPVGAVVNLAARLCADARPGEIVIDDAVRETAGVDNAERRADVDLKGFGVVATHSVTH